MVDERKPTEYHVHGRLTVVDRATVGAATWDTSLLPSYFVALNAKVRKANVVNVGDRITLTFQPRDRR